MDQRKFDSIARGLGQRTSRRLVLGSSLLGLAGLTTTRDMQAQEATSEASAADAAADTPEFLFAQTFTAGTWQPADEASLYTLTLEGTAAQTVYFSDRPERIVGLAPMQTFLDGLGFTPANPPNAALVAQRADADGHEILVIELFDPVYDAETSTLTYTARVLEDYGAPGLASLAAQQTDHELPESFADGSLFIDDCPDGTATCYQIVNNENVVVGPLTNVGCCYQAQPGMCEPCSDNDQSSYYGKLCHEAWPDQCTFGLGEWGCFVYSVNCPDGGL